MLRRYLRELNTARLILWCYLAWYLFFTIRYFDPRVTLWLTSIGLSGIVGFALYLSTARSGASRQVNLDRWQVMRLFLMPFCVSSFAALVKGRGFILVFSPVPAENAVALAICTGIVVAARLPVWRDR